MWIRINLVLEKIIAERDIRGIHRLDSELPHRRDQCLGAVDQILVDGQSIESQFIHSIAILVNDLHLLHDRRLPTLAGSCAQCKSIARFIMQPWAATYPAGEFCIPSVDAASLLPVSDQSSDSSSSDRYRPWYRSSCMRPS
jgi:hypothetical protein